MKIFNYGRALLVATLALTLISSAEAHFLWLKNLNTRECEECLRACLFC